MDSKPENGNQKSAHKKKLEDLLVAKVHYELESVDQTFKNLREVMEENKIVLEELRNVQGTYFDLEKTLRDLMKIVTSIKVPKLTQK